MVIHKCHGMKVLLPPWVLSTLRLEVIVVEDCYNMREIMGSCEDLVHGEEIVTPGLIHNEPSKSCLLARLKVTVVEDCYNMQEIMGSDEHSSPFRIFDKLRVLVLKKLPNLKSIYSGRLLCDSLEEITVGDCPQLTRIPIAISPSLKKIEVDPESLLNTVDNVP